jgi:hypothetical protein
MARFRIVTIALLFGLGTLTDAAAGIGFGLELSTGAVMLANPAALFDKSDSARDESDPTDIYIGNDSPFGLIVYLLYLPFLPIPDMSGAVSLRLGDHFGLGLRLRTWWLIIPLLSYYAEFDTERFTFMLGIGNCFVSEAVFKFTSNFQLGLGALLPMKADGEDGVMVASWPPLVYLTLRWVWHPFGH